MTSRVTVSRRYEASNHLKGSSSEDEVPRMTRCIENTNLTRLVYEHRRVKTNVHIAARTQLKRARTVRSAEHVLGPSWVHTQSQRCERILTAVGPMYKSTSPCRHTQRLSQQYRSRSINIVGERSHCCRLSSACVVISCRPDAEVNIDRLQCDCSPCCLLFTDRVSCNR